MRGQAAINGARNSHPKIKDGSIATSRVGRNIGGGTMAIRPEAWKSGCRMCTRITAFPRTRLISRLLRTPAMKIGTSGNGTVGVDGFPTKTKAALTVITRDGWYYDLRTAMSLLLAWS